jgi:hypothetical protein
MLVRMRLAVVLVALVMLVGCSKLTMENYAKIKVGLGYSEVIKILGKPDSCSEALFVRNCIWGNEQQNITVNFVGDKVILFTSKNIR